MALLEITLSYALNSFVEFFSPHKWKGIFCQQLFISKEKMTNKSENLKEKLETFGLLGWVQD
jgi:hypothetical protein